MAFRSLLHYIWYIFIVYSLNGTATAERVLPLPCRSSAGMGFREALVLFSLYDKQREVTRDILRRS